MSGRNGAPILEAGSENPSSASRMPSGHQGATQPDSQNPVNQAASSSSDPSPSSKVAKDDVSKCQSLPSVLNCPPPPGASQSDLDAYGLSRILRVVRLSNTPLSLLSLGTDLTTLGLNLNAAE